MKRPLLTAIVFAVVSGLYWSIIGQVLPIVVPMMLDDSSMLLRIMVQLAVALLIYVAGTVFFLRSLISQAKAS